LKEISNGYNFAVRLINGWSIISGTNGKYKKFQKLNKSKSI